MDQTRPKVKITRDVGTCDFCGLDPTNVISAYDDRIYAGKSCASCIIKGKASKAFPPNHKVMRPMLFLALAYEGHEPYKSVILTNRKEGQTVDQMFEEIEQRVLKKRDRKGMNRQQYRRAQALSRKMQKRKG